MGEVPEKSQHNVEACIQRAMALGINHIETARGYGTSELQLGRALQGFHRDDVIVQSKIGPKDSGKLFLETFEVTLRHLQLERVDLLAIHGINNRELLDQVLKPGGPVEAALQLKREGRTRWLGFSTHAPPRVISAAIDTGVFDYVNLHWYFVNEINGPAIMAAGRQDMGVFIISPNDKGGKLYEPSETMTRLCAPLSPMQFNDLYCLSREDIHTLSVGPTRPSDFNEHMDGLKMWGRRVAETGRIARDIRAEMDRQLGADWVAHWSEGLPNWDEVPGEVNLWEIIRLWNFATALGMESFAQMRYNLLGRGGHWFPGLNAGHLDEKKLMECLRDYRFAERMPGLLRDAHRRFYREPARRLSSD